MEPHTFNPHEPTEPSPVRWFWSKHGIGVRGFKGNETLLVSQRYGSCSPGLASIITCISLGDDEITTGELIKRLEKLGFHEAIETVKEFAREDQ